MNSPGTVEQLSLNVRSRRDELSDEFALEDVDHTIKRLRKILPIQNPLYQYIHNNMLMEFEDQYFFTAVEKAASLYRATPYLSLQEYKHSTPAPSPQITEEADRCERIRKQLKKVPSQSTRPILRNHILWETHFGESFTKPIHDLLIPLISNFLDQGLSQWSNPWRTEGFWSFFLDYMNHSLILDDWKTVLKKRTQLYTKESDLRALLLKEFELTKLPPTAFEAYCTELCFDLKGWAGMINRLETQPELAPIQASPFPLLEFLAVRILCENAMNLSLYARHHQTPEGLRKLAQTYSYDFTPYRMAHETFEFSLRDEFARTYHQFLKDRALSPSHSETQPEIKKGIQALFCIDDREESLRRHLENIDPSVVTYGVVGFFGLDMTYHALDQSRPRHQCPPIVTPQHEVYEVPHQKESVLSARLRQFKALYSSLRLRSYHQSRAPLSGVFFSLVLGTLSFISLTFRILFPLRTKKLLSTLEKHYDRFTQTELNYESHLGYSPSQMADVVEMILNFAGIREFSSSLVILFAHGSSNSNNPFRQAYGCGACSGNSGFPNSKLFSRIANRADVRALLRDRGTIIPDDVVFIPAHHDTCSDEVTYDLSHVHLNDSQKQLFQEFSDQVKKAAHLNSWERAQFFTDAPPPQTHAEASQLAQSRSIDLAQPRPEYGHSRISLCIVGRRETTLGMKFGRGAFLVSYDSSLDSEGKLLESVSAGAIPVCANISLDYYFSRIDNEGFGAGTKLPLNITSLLGVMRGSKSDLLLGLGRQMVEIHDPTRILVVIEAELEHLERLLRVNKKISNLVFNRWILLARICPTTRTLSYYSESEGWTSL